MSAGQVPAERLPTAAASLGDLLGRVGQRMTRRLEGALGVGGPNLEQWRVLDLLSDGHGHPMAVIADHAMVPAPTLTRIVNRLVESALVYRRPDETDRRRVLIFLSHRGREWHDTLAPEVARVENEIAEELGKAEFAHFVRLLKVLVG